MDRTRKNDLHKLDVFRCALELYRQIGAIVARFPHGEAELRSQMKRASRSVPHNIGEGVGKRGKARAASYEIALGEAKELIVALDCVEIIGWQTPQRSSPRRTSRTACRPCSPN